MAARKAVTCDLKLACAKQLDTVDHSCLPIQPLDVVSAIRRHIECLATQEKLNELGDKVRIQYADIFLNILHASALPNDFYARITLKDPTKSITMRSYSTPRKYKEAWALLIQEHLDAGRIRPSNSAHASPAFMVPKMDPLAVPRWVNDYCILNSNTILDAHPLPCVDDILADCGKGRVWSKLDMTNSFFQTLVHPDDVPLTAVSRTFGLYEWLVMPMGLKNTPPIHQCQMTAALRKYIGRFCHVYIDDIVIWSNSLEEHREHVDLIMQALQCLHLYLNAKKCQFFVTELNFLGHHISARGIEPQSSKCDKIMKWPKPRSATDVRSFLGLVRYIVGFLPKLADHTVVLTPLTTKDSHKLFPPWTAAHDFAFELIKTLVCSVECLTVIDHANPGDKKIFLTCDASDWRTGATLSFGSMWETARPVAFDSAQLLSAEKSYPVHEKELLAIVRALKKWRSDLIGSPIYVYTDHKTLINFDIQCDLSRRQL